MGSLFGSSDKTTTSNETLTRNLPGFIKGPIQDLAGNVDTLANQPFTPFTDQRFAQFNPDEQQAFGITRDLIGQAPADIGQAQALSAEVGRRGLEGFSQAELQPFMNPFIQNVLDVARGRQFDNFDLASRGLRDRATQAGSFGGSRFGLAEAQLSEDFQRQLSEFDQLGLAQSFDRGLGAAERGNQLAGNTAINLANIGTAKQASGFQDANALVNVGQKQRALQQAGLDFNFEEFLRQQNDPFMRQQFASNILNPIGQLTAGSTKNSQTTESGGDSGFLGKALGIASLVAAPFTGGASLLGGAGGLASTFGGIASGIGAAGSLFGGGGGGISSGLTDNLGGASLATSGNETGRLLTGFEGGEVTPRGFQGGGEVGMLQHLGSLKRMFPNEDTSFMGKEVTPGGVTGNELMQFIDSLDGNNIPMDLAGFPSKRDVRQFVDKEVPFNLDNKNDSNRFLDALQFVESGGEKNPNKAVSKSNAMGAFQFKGPAMKDTGLKDPSNFNESRTAAGKYARQINDSFVRNEGRNAEPAEIYLGYQQGPSGARKLINNPNKLAVDVRGRDKIIKNGGNAKMTSKQFVDFVKNKFDRAYVQAGLKDDNKMADGGVVGNRFLGGNVFGDFLNSIDKDRAQFLDNPDLSPLERMMNKNVLSGELLLQNLVSGTGKGIDKIVDTLSPLGKPSSQRQKEKEARDIIQKDKENFLLQNLGLQKAGLAPPLHPAPEDLQKQKIRSAMQSLGLEGLLPNEQTQGQEPQQRSVPSLASQTRQQRAPDNIAVNEPQKAPQEKKNTFNAPLFNFGASLLTSKGDFFQALGEGAQAFSKTKSQQEHELKKELGDNARLELDRLKADVYTQDVQGRINQQNSPVAAAIQQVKLNKLLQEASGEKDLQKQRIKIFEIIKTANPEITPEEAFIQAGKFVATNALVSGQAAQTTDTGAPIVKAEDFFGLPSQ